MRKGRVKIIIGVVVTAFLLGWGALYVATHYPQWRAEQQVRRVADELKRIEEEDYQRAMADTYGGETPQETLGMFIDAVEAGDYELASKYFIGERQTEWRESLISIIREKKQAIFLAPLIETLNIVGDYNETENAYYVRKPVSVDLKLYPNGIWKIVEI